ncbi:DUF5666 domain-containing protein [Actinoplanes subtropicus]|uniref:DUF5666 domain-containing protein n=1 Tax=Actinoplanes subtropicus TaxID=543632 RepID=UPI000690297E|nr:DUF5666 domain-containing protein [Actinoplanes subtropicus]
MTAAPKRRWTRITVALGALLIVVGGFVGGITAEKLWGVASTTATGPAAGFTGGFPGGGQPGGTATTGTPATGTTGTVTKVDGTTIYVRRADGTVLTVKTDGNTAVSTATDGELADVKAGQSVTVQGATGADGSVTATSVKTEEK